MKRKFLPAVHSAVTNSTSTSAYCPLRLLLAIFLGGGIAWGADAPRRNSKSTEQPDGRQTTERAMRLLSANCLSCHNAEKHKGGLQLLSRGDALKGGDGGPVLVPGKPNESALFKALAPDADPHMPPKKQLSTNQIELMRRWIAAGAPWDETRFGESLCVARSFIGFPAGILSTSARSRLVVRMASDWRSAVGTGFSSTTCLRRTFPSALRWRRIAI